MRTCIAIILLLSSLCTTAQSIISGTVKDQVSKQPVSLATISLLKLPDSLLIQQTVTDKKGNYSFKVSVEGNYLVLASFVGYDKTLSPVFVISKANPRYNVPVLEIANLSSKLSNVTVTGKKSQLNTSIDRKIYNVEQDIMSRSGSASDILKNIPSVEVDIEGNVSLRGSGDIMILINGKPSPLMGRTRAEVLQQLPANSIERIEVITNPSARYRPDGTSGIINIVLKKTVRNGFNGSTTFNAGNRDRYNGNLMLNYKPKKFNLFGSASLRQDNRNRFSDLDRTYMDPQTSQPANYYFQHTGSSAIPHAHILSGGIDYTPDASNSFGIAGTYFSRKQTRNDISNTLRHALSGQLTGNTNRLRYDPEFENQKNLSAYWQRNFKKEDHELRVEFNASKEDELEDNHYTNTYILPSQPTTFDNTSISQKTNQKQLTIDYANRISESAKLEAGYDGLYNKIDLNFYGENFDPGQNKFIKDPIKSNQFLYNENIHAVYITFQQAIKKWGYSVGLRSEAAFTTGKLVTLDSSVKNNYFKVYPTVHLSYQLKDKQELQLNYGKRVNRAEADELNPFPEYQDSLNLRAGNPKLKPEIIHSIETGFKWDGSWFSFVPSIYFRYKVNGFTSVVIPLNDSVLLSTVRNLASDQSAGLELIFSARPSKWFNASLSTNFFYNRIDAGNLGFIGNRSIVSMATNLNTNFTISNNSILQISTNYRSPRLTPQGKFYGSFVLNTGFRQDFLKNKFSATFTASDLFKSLRQKTAYSIPSLQQLSRNRRDGRIVYMGISYRFGVIKKAKEEKLQFDNSL